MQGHESAEPGTSARGISVLFPEGRGAHERRPAEAPAYFIDLNLDQVVDAVTAGRAEYDLAPFFCASLDSVDVVAYRHEVFRDLAREGVAACISSFADGMRTMRAQQAQAGKLRYREQRHRWFLEAVATYCETVGRLGADLERLDVRSRGLVRVREFLGAYVRSAKFGSLRSENADLAERLAGIEYSVQIKGDRVSVRGHDAAADYSREVEETFARFRQGTVKDHRVRLPSSPDMNHVEASVLHGVTRLHPEVFAALAAYSEHHRDHLDATIGRFDREIQFYVAYAEHIRRLEAAGLRFCLPDVSDESKAVRARETFDLALAHKLVADGARVVCNDFHLDEPERIIVVSGPNQGGKTTFARTFGQLHHLAAVGCPVPGAAARLFLFDALFTHFEKEEDIRDLSGKLGADLERIHSILEDATPRRIVIMNESFSATTLQDAVFLGTRVLEALIELDVLCVCVTFVDELSVLSDTTVSMVSAIVPGDPAQRTFKIDRRPADGLAYAAVLAAKYGLTYDALQERIEA